MSAGRSGLCAGGDGRSECPSQIRSSVDSYPSSSDPSDTLEKTGSDNEDDCDKSSDKEDDRTTPMRYPVCQTDKLPSKEDKVADQFSENRVEYYHGGQAFLPAVTFPHQKDLGIIRDKFTQSASASSDYRGSHEDGTETPMRGFTDDMNTLGSPDRRTFPSSKSAAPEPEQSLDLSSRRAMDISSQDLQKSIEKEQSRSPGSPSRDRPTLFPINGEHEAAIPSRERAFSNISNGREMISPFSTAGKLVSPYSDSSSSPVSFSSSSPAMGDSKLGSEMPWVKQEPPFDSGEGPADMSRDGKIPQVSLSSAQLSKVPISIAGPSFFDQLAMVSGAVFPRGVAGPGPRLPVMSPVNPAPFQGQVFSCHLCSFTASSKGDFDNHMRVHYKYECPQCDYISRTPGRLQKHIKDSHCSPEEQRVVTARPKVYRCKQCNFSTTDKEDSYIHRRTHIKPEKQLHCPTCSFVTEHKHHLEYHVRNHDNIKPFKCSKCNYSCVNKSMLNSHMKSHTKACQFRCANCSFASKYSHGMKMHILKTNHQMGAVLNSDGSFPQAEVTGHKLPSKQAPDPAPQKEGNFREGMMSGFFPASPAAGIPPAVPSLHHMMSSGMFSYPVWPFMSNYNNMQMNPSFMALCAAGRARQDAPRVPQKLDQHSSPPASSPQPAQDGSVDMKGFPCRRCSFTSKTIEGLEVHEFEVHNSEKSEKRENMPPHNNSFMYRLDRQGYMTKQHPPALESTGSQTSQEEALSDLRMKEDRFPSAENVHLRHHSEDEYTPHIPAKSTFETDMSADHRQRADSPARDTVDMMYHQTERSNNGEKAVNILQQMTQKFGMDSANSFQSMAPDNNTANKSMSLERQDQDAVDLRKKSFTPSSDSSSFSSLQNLPKYPRVEERQCSEADMDCRKRSAPASEDIPAQPRKRSRKGKAFKLDMLYLKRQEQQKMLESLTHGIVDGLDSHRQMNTDQDENRMSRRLSSPLERKTEMDHTDPRDEAEFERDRFRMWQPHHNLPPNTSDIQGDDSHFRPKSDSEQGGGSVHEEKVQNQKNSTSSSHSLADSLQEEDDPVKEREELIQQVFKNRRQQVPESVRRGTEVAWKMLTDPSLGLQLPPETPPPPVSEGGQSSDAVFSAPSSPPQNSLRRNSFSTFSSPEKKRKMDMAEPSSIPSSMASEEDLKNFYRPRSFSAAASMALARKDNGVAAFPSGFVPSAKLTMPMLPHRPSSTKENAPFSHYAHRLSASVQTMGQLPRGPGINPFGVPPRGHLIMPPWRSFECQYCEISFKDNKQYTVHMSFHQYHNPFECRRCGNTYENKVDFYRHLLVVKHD